MSNDNQQRTSLGPDDDPIDLEEFTTVVKRPAPTKKQQAIMKAGEHQSFVSLQPKKRRWVSP